jgi:hypothetical protein
MVEGVGAVVDVVTDNTAQILVCPITSTVTSSRHTIGMAGTRHAKLHESRPPDVAQRGQPHVATRPHLSLYALKSHAHYSFATLGINLRVEFGQLISVL